MIKEYDVNAPKTIVTDMDEVLVNISHIWYNLLLGKKQVFGSHFDFNKASNSNDIFNREEYYLNNWLLKDGMSLPKEKLDEFLAVYDTPTFYQDYCTLTTFGKGLILMGMQKVVKKIYILSHCVSNQSVDSKYKFICSQYKDISSKIEFIPIVGTMNKPEKYAFMQNVDYDMYAEDRLDVMEDVIDNTDSSGREFIMPNLGYNKVTPEFVEKIADKEILYNRYDNIF